MSNKFPGASKLEIQTGNKEPYKRKVMSISLPESLYNKLRNKAYEEKMTISKVIRHLIENYINPLP
jgi:macrodomain Ter protein organizer (MatP/YcbG family)